MVYHGFTNLVKENLRGVTGLYGTNSSLGQLAASRGHFEILRLFQLKGMLAGSEVNISVNSGKLDIFKHLALDPKQTVTVDAMDNAAKLGDLSILRWFHENRTEGCSSKAIDYAAISNNTEIVEWLYANRTEGCSHIAFDWAARNANIPMIELLLRMNNNHHNLTTRAIDMAALQGRHDMIKYLMDKFPGLGCTTDAMDNAASNGHLETLRFLHENRTEGCSRIAMHSAALGGYYDIVQYLHENTTSGCIDNTISRCILLSHREIAIFLLEHREERDGYEILNASIMGDLEIVRIEAPSAEPSRIHSAVVSSITNGRLDVFLYLYPMFIAGPFANLIDFREKFLLSGHRSMLEHYINNQTIYRVFDRAIEPNEYIRFYTKVNFIAYLISNQLVSNDRLLYAIIVAGNLPGLIYFEETIGLEAITDKCIELIHKRPLSFTSVHILNYLNAKGKNDHQPLPSDKHQHHPKTNKTISRRQSKKSRAVD